MPSATLAWRRLPARRRSAAADSRIVEAILELLATVPSTDRHQETTPGHVARQISRRAAAKAAVIAGSLAMPPGPLGWLTIAPELLAVWKIQAQMVSDFAGIYGKAATLTKEHMVYCLFRHTAAQLLRDVAVRVAQRSAGGSIACMQDSCATSCDDTTPQGAPMKKRTKAIAAIAIAFYVAGIITAIHAVMTVRTPQGAIAWSVSLVSFPFIAVPAYLVFGRSKFEGMVQAYDARRTEIDALEAQVRRNIDPWVAEAELRPAIYTAVRRLTGMALTHGNDVELLIDGEATFVSLLKGIAEAHDYILFQFYMIHDDVLGRRVQQALIERAKAGVRVYVLYDEVGSSGLPWTYVDKLRKAGVEVSAFKATQGVRNRFQLNFRNHRKMVVVDGVTGWVGGHNVGDEYLGHDPEFSPWRDTHVRLEGPVVTQLQAVIAQDWYWATRRIPPLNWTPRAAARGDVHAMITPAAPTTQLETSGSCSSRRSTPRKSASGSRRPTSCPTRP